MEISRPVGTIQPICPYFFECGGCDSQDVPYSAQIAHKEIWLKTLWKSVANEDLWAPIVSSPEEYPVFFRNKIRFSFIRHEGIVYPSRHRKGAEKADIPVELCYLESETANAIIRYTALFAETHNWSLYDPITHIGWLKHLLIREGKQTGELLLSTVTDTGTIPGKKEWITGLQQQFPALKSLWHTETWGSDNEQLLDTHLWGEQGIMEEVGEFRFFISPHAFFQTNGNMIKTLYDQIYTQVTTGKHEVIWDLYAGSATIGIYVSQLAKEVVSIENNPTNIVDARENLTLNSIKNLQIVEGGVENVLTSQFIREHTRPDLIIVDPPRAGLSPTLKNLLPNLGPHRLIYVSCNPATCVRDCRELQARGYTIKSLQGIDMFPHTWHCEMMIELEK